MDQFIENFTCSPESPVQIKNFTRYAKALLGFRPKKHHYSPGLIVIVSLNRRCWSFASGALLQLAGLDVQQNAPGQINCCEK